MGLFNNFKKKKVSPETSINDEFRSLFGNSLDRFAKEEFDVDISSESPISDKDITETLQSLSIPDCSEHAYQKYLYGEKLYKAGNIEKSENVLLESIKLGYLYPAVFNRLAIIYRKQKLYDKEVKIIESAIKLYAGKIGVETALRDLKNRLIKANALNEKQKNQQR